MPTNTSEVCARTGEAHRDHRPPSHEALTLCSGLLWRQEGGRPRLFQVRPDNIDDVLGSLFSGFRVPRHVVADVVLHQLPHQAIDGAADGGQALQDVRTGSVFVQGALNGFQLAQNLLGPIQQV